MRRESQSCRRLRRSLPKARISREQGGKAVLNRMGNELAVAETAPTPVDRILCEDAALSQEGGHAGVHVYIKQPHGTHPSGRSRLAEESIRAYRNASQIRKAYHEALKRFPSKPADAHP